MNLLSQDHFGREPVEGLDERRDPAIRTRIEGHGLAAMARQVALGAVLLEFEASVMLVHVVRQRVGALEQERAAEDE
jgi:hypothetical protein